MTVPIEAYVSVIARELVIAAKGAKPTPEGNVVACSEARGWFVLVAKGPIARELEAAFTERQTKPPPVT